MLYRQTLITDIDIREEQPAIEEEHPLIATFSAVSYKTVVSEVCY